MGWSGSVPSGTGSAACRTTDTRLSFVEPRQNTGIMRARSTSALRTNGGLIQDQSIDLLMVGEADGDLLRLLSRAPREARMYGSSGCGLQVRPMTRMGSARARARARAAALMQGWCSVGERLYAAKRHALYAAKRHAARAS